MLTEIAPNLFVLQRPLAAFGLVPLGTRMTIVRLGGGELLVHSPVALDETLAAHVAALGEVRYIVAPNNFHHLFAASWHQAYPGAQLFGAPGLVKKRPDLRLDGVLSELAEGPWGEELAHRFVAGMPALAETVFLHRPSGSLLTCDLLVNFPDPSSWAMRLYLAATVKGGMPGVSRVVTSAIKDRAATRASLDQVLQWAFERIVLCHGDIVEQGGRDILQERYRWL